MDSSPIPTSAQPSSNHSSPSKSHKKRKHHHASHESSGRASGSPDSPRKKKKHRKHSSETRRSSSSATALSPFAVQTTSLYLPLSPINQSYPLEGLCAEHLSPLLLTYYQPLGGIIISYSKARLSAHPLDPPATPSSRKPALAKSLAEYAAPYIWLTAEFLVFRPARGVEMAGRVNMQSQSHIGLVCWNLFNASVEARRLPRDWRWVEPDDSAAAHKKKHKKRKSLAEEGHYVDGRGEPIDLLVGFRVRDFETGGGGAGQPGFVSIEGTMLTDEEEKKLQLEEETKAAVG